MKKLLFTVAGIFFAGAVCHAQTPTPAPDFTATDCNGISHNLYNDLNAGQVVVLVWVMPCGACINNAKGAYDAVQTFNSSNPGRIKYYMADDFGNTSCGTLQSWANTNYIKPNVTFFPNAGKELDETNWDGTGMPHVVVIGGDRKIYFNSRNGSNEYENIKSAIETALANSDVEMMTKPEPDFTISPNPAVNTLEITSVSGNISTTEYMILNSLGQEVLSGTFTSGKQSSTVDISTLSSGMYLLQLKGSEGQSVKRFVVSK
jgi:hypothetical protein